MKTSIAIGSLVGLVLGASFAVAIDRGWLADVVGDSTPAAKTPPAAVETVPSRTDAAADDDVHRPLRPGGLRYGMTATGAPRVRQS